MAQKISIHWFRQDLRLADNPSLLAATTDVQDNHCDAQEILPIYILDDIHSGPYKMGGASRVWLYHSLVDLSDQIARMGTKLHVYAGDPIDIFSHLSKIYDIKSVHWNRCYEPWRMQRDEVIKTHLKSQNITVKSHQASLLWEPWTISKKDGGPYKVFTPFYRKGCLSAPPPRAALPRPNGTFAKIDPASDPASNDGAKALTIDDLNLLPKIRWDTPMAKTWDISESGALAALNAFINHGIAAYKDGRNLPDKPYVSRLSPYLRFGQISPHMAWSAAQMVLAANDTANNTANNTGSIDGNLAENIDCFCSELGWREFSYHLLYHQHDLPDQNIQSKFNNFPWQSGEKETLTAWQKGVTGIPMVDAGMRELWMTGYMHNRSRMITASFLVKNLLVDWRAGRDWFWDCLYDADLASNSASWQWVAGCGADAAPYFRIFNPVTQGQKFDPDGHYIRQYVPELKKLPNKFIHCPWEAPKPILQQAGIILGETYPKPIVDLKSSRQRALDAYESIK